MLKRRVARLMTAGFLLTVTASGLSACRTAPNVAAYVGDGQITVRELEDAVADRMQDEDVAAFAGGQGSDFRRRVLTVLVGTEVYDVAAERYGVEVTDTEVRDRLDELLGGQDPDAAYGGLAAQGYGRADVFENVRELVLREKIAAAVGKADALTDTVLKARYEATKGSITDVSMGYITVPDQQTAGAVLARLAASPGDYEALAAQYAGQYTLPELEARSPDQIPAVLAEGVAAAAPNTGFATPVPEAGGIVVTFVQGPPTFEQLRGQLEQQASAEVDKTGAALVSEVRDDLHVRVNPRYGVLKDGDLVAGGGVVDILDGEDSAAG